MAKEIPKNNLTEPKGKWGGAQPGAGRPKHSKNKSTIEREEALRQFKERVATNTHKLFNAQLDLAIGEKYLMVVRTIGSGTKSRRETEVVTNIDTIKQYLDSEGNIDTDGEYYFMTTKPANNMALDSLLNRTFGRPKDDEGEAEEINIKFEIVNKVPEPKKK